jgi:DNA-binding response OmpR family regulator
VIPVIILSGSPDEDDIRQAYALAACAYLVKPSDSDGLLVRLKSFYDFFKECEVPQVNNA